MTVEADGTVDVHDQTGTNMINLRRTIYLTIMSALDFEEAVHKLLRIDLAGGQEVSPSFQGAALIADLHDAMTDRDVQHDYRMLFARAIVLQVLRIDGRAILEAESSMVDLLRAVLPDVLQHDSSLRNEPTSKYRSILWSPTRHRRYSLDRPRRRQDERRRHHFLFSYFYQNSLPGDLGGHGVKEIDGTIQGS